MSATLTELVRFRTVSSRVPDDVENGEFDGFIAALARLSGFNDGAFLWGRGTLDKRQLVAVVEVLPWRDAGPECALLRNTHPEALSRASPR